MKSQLIFALAGVGLIFQLGCSKLDEGAFDNIPTELEVTILDDQDDAVEEAQVLLYRDRASAETRTSWIARDTTDEDGKVIFSGLEAAQYFVYAYYEDGNDFYDNSKSSFALPEVLRESSLTKINVQTDYTRPANPTTVEFMGIHYPYDYEQPVNNGVGFLRCRIVYNSGPTVAATQYHFYDQGRITLYSDDLSLDMDEIYAQMEDMFPFNINGYNQSIANIQSQNTFTLILDHINDVNIFSNSVVFDLEAIVEAAIDHPIPYPNRMRVGMTNTQQDELEFDILLEWN